MNEKITCPNCGHQFDIEEALAGKLEAQFKAEFEKKIADQALRFQQERERLEKEKENLELQKEKQEEILKARLLKEMEQESLKIRRRAQEHYEEKLTALQQENDKRKAENKALKEMEVSLMRRESELREKQESVKLDVEREMLLRQKEIEEKARVKERESFELEKLKLLKQIDDNKKLAESTTNKLSASEGNVVIKCFASFIPARISASSSVASPFICIIFSFLSRSSINSLLFSTTTQGWLYEIKRATACFPFLP